MPLPLYDVVDIEPPTQGNTYDDDDALLWQTGMRGWEPPTWRIKAHFTATAGDAQLTAGSTLAACALRSTDRAAGYAVDAAAQLADGEVLVRVLCTVTAYDQGGGSAVVPRGLWWHRRHADNLVVVRFGSRFKTAQPGTDYQVVLALRSSGGAVWESRLPLLRCRR